MNTLAERLSYILKERGKSAADLARATGKTESAVSQWLSGETKSMRSDSLMAACALLRRFDTAKRQSRLLAKR